MSSTTPSFLRRTKRWLLKRKSPSAVASIRGDEKQGPGLFSKAHDFTINGGQFTSTETKNYINEMNTTYVNNVIANRSAVFELLEPYACLDATKDSSARYPPPKCHPGTRSKIRDKLMNWLCGDDLGWKMLWLRGFAGTGKSAVAQSFAESCDDGEMLGGSYFFSRTTGRNKLKTVVPTIVYQLSICIPEYHSLVERQLAKNPLLLRNSPPVQFRKLIVEPFATLQRQCSLKPVVVILDGLDECEGEDAQLEILEMITNSLRTNPDLPLRWLIISRPEAHLKDAFLKLTNCGREELIIDAECRDDVEKYTRERISQIKDRFQKLIAPGWPPENQVVELLEAVSGLFVLASTCLNYIGDPEEADPHSQLDDLLTFLRRSQEILSRNPLAALDLLYSRILENISPIVFETSWRIMAHMSHKGKIDERDHLNSARTLCNFLRLEQRAFYKALRGLHSVLIVPDPDDATRFQVKFHHASFQDFLLDRNRCGRFVIDKRKALVDIIKSGISWADADMMHFHTEDAWVSDYTHNHDSLPGLTWASDDNAKLVSKSILLFFEGGLFLPRDEMPLDAPNEDLLSHLSNVDFRFWAAGNVYDLTRLCRLEPSTSLVRTEPSSPTDHKLLEYFNILTNNGIAKPAIFPLRNDFPEGEWVREYFIIGHGLKSVILWRTESPISGYQAAYSLRCDKEPSEEQMSAYQEYLQNIRWDEEAAKLEMK
ncbi:hypothetical protein Agabi119p4_6761 [Agaricus bisporus var. burnettii]|uniref:Nephrocystin 3-like N-terminal domain-containing protein n=1 Tax=Agaricus bisporus var. burnettii TaxID=192524 RepID=A0A8H7C904_AGABI|nr:hypothetical protein Agabi119p4_6761 [Agaricus bisporus var. burnettii]